MKNMYKQLFCIVMVFFPAVLYSQVLEPADIDIFINGYEQLWETVWEHNSTKYFHQLDNTVTSMEVYLLLSYDLDENTENNIAQVKTEYEKVQAITVPAAFKKTFRRIGWNNNGHEKFTVILYIAGLFDMETESPAGIEELLKLFHENDIAIVRERISDLLDL